MAKQSSLNNAPADFPIEYVNERYTLVTEENKAEVLIKGRTLYVFSKGKTKYTYNGFFDIRPRHIKGVLTISNHPIFGNCKCLIKEAEDKEEYFKSIRKVIEQHIEQKQLYFKESDKIVQYQFNN